MTAPAKEQVWGPAKFYYCMVPKHTVSTALGEATPMQCLTDGTELEEEK